LIECFEVRSVVRLRSAKILSYYGAPKSISGVLPDGINSISGNKTSTSPGPYAA